MQVQANTLDLRLYVDILVRNRWWVLLAAVIAGVVAGVVAYTSPKIYESKATILVEDDAILQALTKRMAVAPSITSKMRFVEQRLLTRDHLTQIARRLDLDLKAQTPKELEALLNRMRSHTVVGATGRGQLIEIGFQHNDPTVARDVVAMLTDMLLEENLGAKRVEAHQAYDFINQQLQVYRTRLEESERKLREFKQKNLVELGVGAALPAGTGGNDGTELAPRAAFADVNRLDEARANLSKVELDLRSLRSERATYAKQLELEPKWISAQQDFDNGTAATRGQEDPKITAMKAKIDELRLRYTDRHPAVVALQAQVEQFQAAAKAKAEVSTEGGAEGDDVLANLGEQILNPHYQRLKEKVSQLDAEVTAAEAKRGQLKREIVGLGKAILDVPKKEQVLLGLRRDYSVNSSIYNDLLKRLEEARVTKEMEVQDRGGRIRVIEPATVPYKPVKPNRVLIICMGLGGGLVAGYGFGFLRHLMDSTIRSSDEVQGLVGLTVLGRIPTVVTHGDRRRRHHANLAFGMATVMTVAIFGSLLWLEIQGIGIYPLRALVGV